LLVSLEEVIRKSLPSPILLEAMFALTLVDLVGVVVKVGLVMGLMFK